MINRQDKIKSPTPLFTWISDIRPPAKSQRAVHPAPSDHKKKVFPRICLALLTLFIGTAAAPAWAGEITLEWTPCDVAGYYIVYWDESPQGGESSPHYTNKSEEILQPTSAIPSLTHTVTGLTPGKEYSFAVQSFSEQHTASGYSDEVCVTIGGAIAEAGDDQSVFDTTDGNPTIITLNGNGSSAPEGSAPTYAWKKISGPPITFTNSTEAIVSFSAPAVGPNGAVLKFELVVANSYGNSQPDYVVIYITHRNQPPKANAGGDQFVFDTTDGKPTLVTLNGSGSSDPEGATLTYLWSQIGTPTVSIIDKTKAIASFKAPAVTPKGTVLKFKLTVTDPKNLNSQSECAITVTMEEPNPQTTDLKNASMEIIDNNMAHEKWLSIGWEAYRNNNNEARVATGDLDGDGVDEFVIGLGQVKDDSAIPGGYFQIISHDFKHLAWGKIPDNAYNEANGETWPACGDLDGDDGCDEIIMGRGLNGKGIIDIFTYADNLVTHVQSIALPSDKYNEINGETRPACGDIDGDGCVEIIVGLGALSSKGNYAVFDRDCSKDLTTQTFELKQWGRTTLEGGTWSACGDIIENDKNDKDEILLGLSAGGKGKIEIVAYNPDDNTLTHVDELTLDWPEYNERSGETRPACGDIHGDPKAEILIGLGPITEENKADYGQFAITDAETKSFQWRKVDSTAYDKTNGESRVAAFTGEDDAPHIIVGFGSNAPGLEPDQPTPVPEARPKSSDGGSSGGCFIKASH